MLTFSTKKLLSLLFILYLPFAVQAQNQALDLSGTGNEVNVTYNLATGPGFTVEQWIYIPVLSAGTSLVNQSSSNFPAPLDAYVVADGSVNLLLGNGTASFASVSTAPGTISAATWHHVAFVYDPASPGSEGQIFIDGNSTPAVTVAEPAGFANIGPIRIGRRADAFEGDDLYLDEVRIWSTPRSGIQISGDYNQELIGNETGLDVYLRFEGDTDDDAFVNLFQNGSIAAGSVGYVAGAPIIENNYALDFDGIDGYVSVPDADAFSFGNGSNDFSFTVEAWAKFDNIISRSIISKRDVTNEWHMTLSGGGQLSVALADQSANAFLFGESTGLTFNTDQWYHLAFSYDGSSLASGIQLYVDGVAVTTIPSSSGIYTAMENTASTVQIGALNTSTNLMDGQVDEIRVWNTQRSDSQISAFKDVELNPLNPGLVGYFDFSNGPNNGNVSDLKGGGPGILTNMDIQNDWVAATHGIAPAGPLDTTNPDITISSTELNPTAANPIPITFTFTEEVVGFDLADITVSNGTPSNLNTADNIVFTADVTPSADGLVQVDVSGSLVTDLTGNFNNPSNSFFIDYDLTSPIIISTTLSAARNRIYVEFDESVFGAADGSTPVDAGDFTVNTVGGTASVIVNSLNVLGPRDIEFDVTISGVPDGAEVVDVTPNASAVYDAVGNIMSVSQTSNLTGLIDQSVLSFDGADDFVRIAADAAFNNQNYTLEAWVNLKALPVGSDSYTFVSKGTLISDGGLNRNGYTLLYGDLGGGLAIALGQFSSSDTEVVQHPISLSLDTWYHIAGTYDGTTMRLFLDGVEVATNNSLGANDVIHTGDNLDVKIGAMEGDASTLNFHRGLLDEVRVWNYARTDTQISTLMDEELSGTQNGLVAYYDFNDAAGTTLTDIAAARNGTLDPAMNLAGATGNWASGGTTLALADATAPAITFAQDLQTIGSTIIGGTHDDNLAVIEVSLDGGTTRTAATNNGDGTWNYDMSVDPNFGGDAPYTVDIYAIDEAENEGSVTGNVTVDIQNTLSFDGLDDYIEAPDAASLDITGALTLETWVFFNTAIDEETPLITKWNPDASPEQRSYLFQIDNTSQVTFAVSTDGTTAAEGTNFSAIQVPYTFQTGRWYHLAATYEPSSYVRVFVNGEQIGENTTNVMASIFNSNASLVLGDNGNQTEVGVGGVTTGEAMEMDETRIWSVAKSQADIQASIATELTGSEPNLAAYYDFNLTAGTTLTDRSPNGNDATLNDNNNGVADGSTAGPIWGASTVFNSDVLAPFFVSGYPLIDNITGTSFDINVQLNEIGTAHYVLLLDGAAAPTATEVFAATGSGGAIPENAGNWAILTANTTWTINSNTLATSTDYDLYIVAEDDEGTPNEQAVVSQFDVTTLSGPQVFNVTDLGDAGPGTLRQAIIDANADLGATSGLPHIINFTAPGQVTLLDALPTINNHMRFQGDISGTTIHRDGAQEDFRIFDMGAFTVEITDIIIDNGRMATANDDGGGIYANGTTLTLFNSVVQNCTAERFGGGIYAIGNSNVTLERVTIYNNQTLNVGGWGGGIGIQTGTLEMISNTVHGNVSGGNGGGIFLWNGVNFILRNSTVVNNNSGANGGGIVDQTTTNVFQFTNNIIANNTASGSGNDIYQTSVIFSVNNNNIVEDCGGTGCPIFFSTADPNLGLEQTCGIQTYFPLNLGSPAIESGTTTGAASDDICENSYATLPNIGSNWLVPTAAPGGVGPNLSLWLKADHDVTGTTQVSQWDDQSGQGFDATQGTAINQPALTDNALNYNPAITFDGSEDFMVSSFNINPSSAPDLTTILVFNSNQSASTPLRKVFGHDGGAFNRSIGLDNRAATNFTFFAGANSVVDYFNLNASEYYISTSEYTAANNFNGYINGLLENGPSSVLIADAQTSLTIGAISTAGSEPWDGDIAEMIMYSGTLTAPERQRIETYLAIKYGISIDQTAATNYLASDGNPVWDGTAYATFNNHIAGIGRDDASELNQKQSIGSDGRLAMGLGTIAASNQANANTFANDLAYLIWGDNGLDMAYGARDIVNVPAGVSSRISRIWSASEVNSDVGSVTLRFDLNGEGYPGTYNASNFELLVDTDADFSTGAGAIAAASYVGGVVEFNSVNIGDGQVFTLGINEPPLPAANFVVYNSSATEITFEWTDNAFNETGYQILEADNYGFLSGIATVVNIAANSTTYTHTPSADKFYMVIPTNGFEDPTSQSSVEYATTSTFPARTFTFDGSNDYVSIPDDNSLEPAGNFTIEFWLRTTDTGNKVIIDKTNGEYSVQQYAGNTIGMTVGAGLIQTLGTYNDGNWHHFAIVFRGAGNGTIYVDGVDDTDGTITMDAPVFSTNDLNIGGRTTNFNIAADIDEIRIWDDERTLPEIQVSQYDRLVGNEAGLVAYYPVDEIVGSDLVDRSTNTNDGLLQNGTVFSPSTVPAGPAPPPPTNVIAYASSSTAITIEWTDNATDETGYNVERDTDPAFGAPTLVLNNGPANTTSFVDGPLSPDQRFYYRVQPVNGGEDASSYSSTEFGTNLSFAGDALTFDATNDQIAIQDDPSFDGLSTALTIEAWINTSSTAQQEILSQFQNSGDFDGYSFGLGYGTPDGRLSFSTTTGGTNENLKNGTSPVVSDGSWHHVAVSYDGTTATFYVDGVPYTDAGSSIAAANTNSTMYIGRSNLGTRPFNGQIDEVRIWDIVKSDFSDRFATLNGNEANLVAYYPFDEGTGSATVFDASANTNDGIPENGPVFGASTVPLPTPGVVINTNDSGVGSLRDAIEHANANPGTTITFNITGGGPYQITLATALPDITAAGTIIDGTTQPGWTFGDANNMVELDGSVLGTNVSGLVINDVANCEIYGLVVTGFTSISESVASIEINGDNADNAVIGAVNKGNILHNMVSAGISFQDADLLTIQGNRFGTFDGTNRSEINKHVIYGSGTTDNVIIGGDSGAGEGNLISGAGNGRFGLRLNVQGSIFIRGNYIGTNSNGDASIFNEGGGMYLSGAHSGEIGGTSAGFGNVISGNTTGYGIRMGGSVAVINNIIGLDRTGTNVVSNGDAGIIIGGTGGIVVDGNVISGNDGEAITSTTGFGNADIINNIIGFNQSITIARPNAAGIVIDNGPGTDNRFGYKDNPNIIANNTGSAIYLTNTSTGNTFATNQIYNNGSGIDLEAGANGSVAVPTIDNVTATGASGTGVDGTTIHLYLGDGAGQGQTFLDSTTVSGGIWSVPGLSLLVTDEVVATATNYGAGIGTSAFSAAASMQVETVTTTSDIGAGSLREAITNANANPGTTIIFNIGESAPWQINLGSALPQITAAGTIIDGNTQPGWIFGDPNAMVQINGSGIGGNSNGINIDAADVEVYGLIFTGFLGNSTNGNVYLASDAADNAIIGDATRGNIFHASGGNAIYIVDGDNATIQGNRIGTLDGTTASAMGDHGIATTGEINTLTIGGDFFTGEGNLISGAPSFRYGMNLFGNGAGLSNVTISGNKVGTNDAASAGIPNTLGGINILGTVLGVTIGGPSAGDLNVISGNGDHGIIIQAGNGIDIDGNYIGLQSNGTSALANAGSGIRINGAASNINIGTNSQNIISENIEYGIVYDGNTSSNTALGTNIFSCNQLGGIGYGSGPLTPGATIESINLTTATVSTAAADGSTVLVYFADDGCSNDQGIAFAGSGLVASGQAVISGGFAPGAHYVALVEDINGFSEFSTPFFTNFVTVTNTNDSGADSFREAINYANTNPGATILFNIPGGGPWIINVASELPAITGAGTIIDGATQPSWNINSGEMVTLDGNALVSTEDGLTISAANVEVYGLLITQFPRHGISTSAVSSGGALIGTIGKGNVVNNNGTNGIDVGWTNSFVVGNRIGTNAAGTIAAPNGTSGVVLANNTTVTDNLISGHNGGNDRGIYSNAVGGHTILNNLIGTDITGSFAIPNHNGVVLVTGGSSRVDGNLISGNSNAGIWSNTGFNSNDIINNNIGMDLSVSTPVPNGTGILYAGGSGNRIGYKDNPNIIAGNTGPAIETTNAASNNNSWVTNQIYNNGSGVVLAVGANNGIVPPIIGSITATVASGSGINGDMIHLYFSDGTGQGQNFIDSVLVSGGSWNISGLSLSGGEELVATATNATDGTSQFSAPLSFILQNALSLDGTGDYTSSGNIASVNFDRLDPFTLEAWVNTSASGLLTIAGQQEDVGGGTGYRIFIHDGLFRMSLNNTSGTDQLAVNAENSLINDGNWHHVAVTYDGTGAASGVNMYIDGERYNNEIVSDNLVSSTVSTASFSIGSRNDVSQFFNGSIDQVRVWDIERTQDEIYDNAYLSLTSEPNLQLAFDFDQPSGAAVDAVAGNDGTLAGDATYVASTALDNDVFAPLFTSGFPFIDDITDNDFRINSNANEGSFLWVGVYADGATPTADDVVNGTGAITFAAALSSSAVTRIGGGALSQSTNYDVFFVLEDFSTNRQNAPTLLEITTLASTPYPELEGSGDALTFDGADDFVELPSLDLSGRNAITVEAWINPASIPGGPGTQYATIIGEGTFGAPGTSALGLYLRASDSSPFTSLSTRVDNGSAFEEIYYDGVNINTGEWIHVAMTWSSGNSVLLYVNGVQVAASSPLAGNINGVIGDLMIGSSDSGSEVNFEGAIDEVRIWDFEMPESSLREYLARKVTNAHPSYANLLAYYRMDDNGDALNLLDFKNVHNGNINGGAAYNPSGAHLGDDSFYEYVYTAGSGRGIGNFDVENLGVANLPLHIYQINQTPANNVVSGFNNIDRPEYYGVFSPGQTYNVRDSVFGLTSDRRILFRTDGADPTWTSISGPVGLKLDDYSMYAFGQSGSGQFTSATDQSPYPTPVDAGYAMSFDGADDFIQFTEAPLSAMTVEAWVKFASTTNQTVIKYTNSGSPVANISRQIRLNGGVLQHNTFDGSSITVSGATPVVAGQWYHVAITAEDGGFARLYVNGVEQGTALAVGTLDVSGDEFRIGFNSTGDANFFNGEIDEVRVWNTVLTETNIRDNMIEKLDGNSDNLENLITYYRFDENSGVSAVNLTGDNDATITGAIPVISGAPQGEGSLYSYIGTPGVLNTAQFGEDINIHFDDATGGIHGYLVAGNPNQVQADGFTDLDQGRYYGIFAPGGQRVTIRMDYNNGGSYDPNRRIVYRTDASDNAAIGGWERLSGLLNSDVSNDSIFAYNVAQGEVSTALLSTPSSYPILGDTDPGSALDFAGQPEHVVIAGSPLGVNNTGSYTIEAWVNPATFTGYNASYGAGIYRSTNGDVVGDHFLSVFPDGRVGFANNRTGGPDGSGLNITTASIATGTWVHIAATWDGVGNKIYFDGVEQTLTTDNTGGSWGTATEIGRSFTSSDYHFQGQIDEVRIWREAVTEADIIAFANTTDIASHPNYEDMVAYYKFDDGTASTVLVDVFSNNDGTLTSMDENTDWIASGALANAPEQNALNFDGDAYIDFVRQSFPSGLTFEAWINTTSPANTTAYDGNPALTVIGDNNNAIEGAFGVHDGRVRYTHWTGVSTIFDQIDGNIIVNDGEWHHIAVTHKSGSSEVNIYVDGILDVTSISTIYSPTISANRVGSSYLDGTGNDNFFTGDIDEVRIWNVALPEDEIRNFLYADDLSGSSNLINLILHYNFNQGSAGGNNTGETAATDQSSSALDGVLNGFTLNGPTSNFITSGNTSFTPSTPSFPANNIVTSNIMENTVDINWINGDGERRVVLVHEGTGNPYPSPADGTFGEADQYGLGTDLDGGWFVVYNGYGTSTTIENLSGGTDYEVAVLEINGPPTFDAYNTSSAGVNNPISFTTATPISNFALDFGGTNEHVQVASPSGFPLGAAPRTMELWFKSDVDLSVDTDHGIAQYGTTLAGQMFGLITSSNDPGKLYFFGNAADLAGTTTLVQDQWYHAAVTFDGTTLSLYLDGNLEASTTTSLNTVMSGAGFTIGRRAGLENFWDGQIDEVRIWDYARTQTEIQNDMNNILVGDESGLVAYYPFIDGTGSTSVTDATGGPNGALLVNMDENTDWVSGPALGPPNIGSTFFEDFTDAPLPGTASSGPFAFDSGVWDGEGVLESGDIDARGGTGNAARIEPAGGNYIQTPPLDQATSFGFWYKGESSGGVYEVLASTDGGTTWDTSLGTINPDPTYQEFTVDFTSFFDPSYTGSVRIEYISGANALFIDDVSADVDIVRPDVTITTQPLSDANVNQGDTDVMIYKVQTDVSMGTAAFEGFFLNIVGADSLDFQLNGFDFYYNVGSDNFGTATLMGTSSWSPGNPVPRNAIGELFNAIYPDGTSVFYYVTADISPTANATTFNIELPDIEQFGFGGGNKIDGGLTAGNNFTIMAGGDVTAPTVISLAATPNPITDVATQFELVVEFDESMDTGINPTIDFPVEDPSATLTFNTGVWDDALNFRATYDFTDVDVDLADIDVQVTGAQDLAGNAMNAFDGPDAFSIDTENPIITVDTYGTSITSPQLTGTVDDVLATISVDVDGNNYPATNNGDGTWTLAAGIIASLADGTYDVVAYASDQAGNLGTDATTDELVISQSVVTLTAEDVTSTSFTARWSEGLDVQTYQIDVSTVADFSTFVTGFQSTQINATSIAVTDLDFATSYYYRVRLVNTSDEVSANSNTTVIKTDIDAETIADSTALVQIFAAINPQGLNWATDRLRNWTGVDLDAGRTRVDIVDISGTSSIGAMPGTFTGDAVGGLSVMTEMNASNNEISGLMDFSGTAIDDLNVSGNNLDFGDLEPLIGITTLDYSNQGSIDFTESLGGPIEVRYTNDYSLSIMTDGANNAYTWYRNDVAINTGDDFIINNTIGVILAIDYDNMGTFRAEITNTTVPGLTIDVDPQDVLAIADVTMRLTDSNDALLNGETFDGALLEAIRRTQGYDTLESVSNVGAEFVFTDVVLGDYLCGIEPDNQDDFIPTYFGDAFQWDEAEVIMLRSDSILTIVMTADPPELTAADGEGTLDVLIEEDFGDDASRVDARRRAAKRKCGLRRKRQQGGRTDQDDIFDLIAYGETDDNGEFQFGFLPQGTYRFFVEYPGIPLDDSAFVEFEVGEAGVSDTDFKLQAFASEDGIEVTIEAVLGVILEYFKNLEIYPNPSSEYLNIRYRHLKSKDVTAQLIDLSGNTKRSQDLRNGFDGELRIDVTNFEEGVYILRFFDREDPQGNVVSFRVIVKD